MATKVCHVVLIVALLSSAHMAASAPNWVNDLTAQINAMTANINHQVRQFTQDLNSQIQNSVNSALAEADKMIQNLPRDAEGNIIPNNGANMINVSSVGGKSIVSVIGHTPDGKLYMHNIEEHTDGRYVYHNESLYNSTTDSIQKIRWKLNLATGVKEDITDEK